ncbi:MAG: FtsW/RodA/SpoVE family cell cycle protein [Candidatus Altimarinota bacterium]
MLNKQVDYKLFFAAFSLIIFGMIMISSVSVYGSFRVTSILEKAGNIDAAYNYFYVIRNISHIFIAMFLLLFLVKIPYHLFEKYSKHILGANVLLMVYVLLFGETLNGATGWIQIPGIPFLLQPVEFLKFSVVIFLAYFFKKYKDKIHSFQEGFVPFFGLLFGVVIILGLQPDFGSIMILGPIMVMMFFVAGARVKYLLSFFALGIVLFFSVYSLGEYDKETGKNINSLGYISQRIDNFIADEKELIKNKTINYQTEQALIAIGSGGFAGLGFGNSIQKFGYLPEVQGDFIFSVIIEELGFLGGLVLLGFYSFIGYRGYLISYYSTDLFAKYASFGITTWILVQASINIGVNLNLLPLTGLTLPFVSYGGSSLLSLMLGLGVLLNISRYIDETKGFKIKSHNFSHEKVNLYY